ncbi:MAG: hypothetical protein JWM27_2387 [Gemmatimonadetes bacterium]|nr:hypothetical protein [Gemmatimonadota bacterium]
MHEVLDRDLEWVAANGIQQRVPAGCTLIRRGQTVEAVYVVLDGELVVEADAPDEASPCRLRPGTIAGRLGGDGPAPATVRAEVDSVVLEVPRSLLDAHIARDPEFEARMPPVVAGAGAGWVRAARARAQRRPAPRGEPTAPQDNLENLRVYELIERMLRGDLPDG